MCHLGESKQNNFKPQPHQEIIEVVCTEITLHFLGALIRARLVINNVLIKEDTLEGSVFLQIRTYHQRISQNSKKSNNLHHHGLEYRFYSGEKKINNFSI